jgi:hypothetical protein
MFPGETFLCRTWTASVLRSVWKRLLNHFKALIPQEISTSLKEVSTIFVIIFFTIHTYFYKETKKWQFIMKTYSYHLFNSWITAIQRKQKKKTEQIDAFWYRKGKFSDCKVKGEIVNDTS